MLVAMRDDLLEWADVRFLSDPSFSKRKTFGEPSYYLRKKLFAFVFEDGLCIKLPPERVREKIAEDPDIYSEFAPMEGGGVMKNWLLIRLPEADDYASQEPLFAEAFAAF